MRIPIPYPKVKKSPSKGLVLGKLKTISRFSFILMLGLSITFSNYAQDDDSDFLDKVLEDKPKKSESKKLLTQSNTQSPALRDKKRKVTKNTKKPNKVVAKQEPAKRTTPISKPVSVTPVVPPVASAPNPNQITNARLNLEYWIQEELMMNSQNIPGLQAPVVSNGTPVTVNLANNTDKPLERKTPEKTLEVKPNPILAFLNEYKKIIFIFTAIIIFAIYRLRYAGQRNYNNSGRIFSKFRNK